MNVVLPLVLALVFVGCALVKHRVRELDITLVAPISPLAPPAPADRSVVHLDAYRQRRATATRYRTQSHSAS